MSKHKIKYLTNHQQTTQTSCLVRKNLDHYQMMLFLLFYQIHHKSFFFYENILMNVKSNTLKNSPDMKENFVKFHDAFEVLETFLAIILILITRVECYKRSMPFVVYEPGKK